MSPRLLALAAAALSLAAGVAIGARLAHRLDGATRAATAAAVPDAPLRSALAAPDFSAIARRGTPAVVNISALQVYRARRSPFFSDPFFQEFFGQDFPGLRMPLEERKTSLGSGVIVAPDGVIVTNHHVVQQANQIAITTADHKRFRGRLVGTDPVTDIAVVKIDGRDLPSLPWGDSSRAAVGEYVVAIGNPFQLNQTVTMGIISATGRSNVGIVDYEDFIQTDAAINPGNSGGALLNTRSELIGINTAIYSETGGYQGIGFAVPANLARTVVEQLVEHGRVVRGWTGITKISDMAAQSGLTEAEQGVVVVELLRGSPAHAAGVEPGDVVLAVDGRAVDTAAQLRNELAATRVGTRVRLTVRRGGRRLDVDVAVTEPPGRG
ncbi:MAG TPA: trypsin-like peptidase domain-containing protein [Vicinamibacteria bacterium]|nr:trypsin-like peptidase domain-containing protein [Vicinamibacteria bacterium]